MRRIQVIDSHTGGEPTRVIVAGGPELGSGSLAERVQVFRGDYDALRSAVVNEPRGSDVVVGALLCPPTDPACAAGVIYFNNVGYLNMCGHATIGLGVTLAHLGKIQPGVHRVQTPVGDVTLTLEDAHHVAFENVTSYRLAKDVPLDVPGLRTLHGDIAWGGNWFFLVNDHGEEIAAGNIPRLLDVTRRIRRALIDQCVTGAGGMEIDHIELIGAPQAADAHAKCFVLCPGGAFDRSPCGTGTSAKLACLAADGKLAEGEPWRQESIIGSLFTGSYRRSADDKIVPTIRGSAYVTAEATLLLDADDPFVAGFRTSG